jgi:hypothetical protein
MSAKLTGYLAVGLSLWAGLAGAAEPPKADEVEAALRKAVRFFHAEVANGGGYLWEYSGDLKLREAEGKVTSRTVAWVQPPGTPTVGEAFLDAWEATKDPKCLDAARAAADVLVRGQMRTGGWAYSVELGSAARKVWGYRDLPEGKTTRWKRATVLDDDTTPGAIRFLARLDRALDFKDAKVHDAVVFALDSLLLAQYPNGGWFGWWEYPPKAVGEKEYPVKQARYPEKWPRKVSDAPVRWAARYVVNDDLIPDMVRTLLDAHDVYRDRRYLAAAKKAGDFLLLAQMPEPQPAWAQQYDVEMRPCWGRKFEPPAISGAESQTALETLLELSRRTGDEKYRKTVPPALAYLRKSRLADGRLARFYELKTNKPLYFTKDYELTYKDDDPPTHYRFIWDSRLDAIEAEWKRQEAKEPPAAEKVDPGRVRAILDKQDPRGAWVEKGSLRFHRTEPAAGVIRCQTFADNVRVLARFLIARQPRTP